MARESAVLENLRCSICTEFFTEPVTLSCEGQHTFCRSCIQASLNAGHGCCPECRTPIKKRTFKVNRILSNMVEELKGERGHRNVCAEHGEMLQIYCLTDKALVCLVCRDSRAHKGHKFQPLKEAAQQLKKKVQRDAPSTLALLREDISKVEKFVALQRSELNCSKERADRIKGQIRAQFKELVEELKKTEQEELRKVEQMKELVCMQENLTEMEKVLARAKERESSLQSALDCKDLSGVLLDWQKTSPLKGEHQGLSPSASFPRLSLRQNRLEVRQTKSLSFPPTRLSCSGPGSRYRM
uniref:Uncharacterized protein n=1 Tax=Denticeps clupeoides TaxID=299321 RepID=A0AAY4CUM6_9TELE